jgi:hypothetical protein
MKLKEIAHLLILNSLALACGGGGGGGSVDSTTTPPLTNAELQDSPIYTEDTSELQKNMSSLPPISSQNWTVTAVQKVLHTFALGSAATHEQITRWASLSPETAIREILSLNAINPMIRPDTSTRAYSNGELSALAKTWHIEEGSPRHGKYWIYGDGAPANTWIRAILSTGLNPVRQRMGLYETNDHMAINSNSSAEGLQIFRYYNDILNRLTETNDYAQMIATAASSAAIATQYNHRINIIKNGTFMGNEDFAREFHQLFFGILGIDDSNRHEKITIKNTAKALTDIKVVRRTSPHVGAGFLPEKPIFGTDEHHSSSLNILDQAIQGGNAHEKIAKLSSKAIEHSESLNSLPIKMIQSLAHPNMDPDTKANLIEAWKTMPQKNPLAFLRAYAISDSFHSQERFKAWNHLERQCIIANRLYLSDPEREEQSILNELDLINAENLPFTPAHDVFGSQKGEETLASSYLFASYWESSTYDVWKFKKSYSTAGGWEKDWSKEMPKNSRGEYLVGDVALWLWSRFIADGGKNFGWLEKAQVYSLLSHGIDYGLHHNKDNPLMQYSEDELQTQPHQQQLSTLAQSLLYPHAESILELRRQNENIGLAIAFIVMTPYMYGQEGI